MSNVNDSHVTESTEEKPGALTQEDVVKVVNSAITNHLKRLDLSKQITSALDVHLAPFKEILSKNTEEAPKEDAPKRQNADKSSSAAPELLAMQKKMEAMEKQFKAREEALTAKERAASEKSAFAKVKSELTSFQGLRSEAVDPVAKLLKAEGRIHVDEEGEVSYLDDDGETTLDFKTGLKKYLDPKSNPMAALYLAPKGANASHLKGSVSGAKSSVSPRTFHSDSEKSLPPAQRAALQLERMGLKV